VIVTVFGSANARPGDALYESAYTLGVCWHSRVIPWSPVAMAARWKRSPEAPRKPAVAHWASPALRLSSIARAAPTHWVQQEIQTQTLLERLEVLTRQPDAMIACLAEWARFAKLA